MERGGYTKAAILFVAVLVLAVATVSEGSWNAQTQRFTPSSGQVVFYTSEQCKGEPFMVLNIGNYPDFRNYRTGGSGSPSWNDKASCIVVAPFTKVIVYEHINYRGKSKEYIAAATQAMFTLSGDRTWNNEISSCKVLSN